MQPRFALVAAIVLAGCGSPPPVKRTAPPLPGLAELMKDQALRYPLIREDDLYKLLYQACFASQNLFIGDNSKLESGLQGEIAAMKPPPLKAEDEVEMLCVERNLARINLRPFLAHGGKADDLAHAIADTGLHHRGDLAEFEATLAAAADLVDGMGLRFSGKEFRAFIDRMDKRHYPPGTHSEDYAEVYAPAYRIVELQYLTDARYGGRTNQPMPESQIPVDTSLGIRR